MNPNTIFTLTALDPILSGGQSNGSGVNQTEFRVVGDLPTGSYASFTTYLSPFKLKDIVTVSTMSGTFVIEYRSRDNVTNLEPSKSQTVSVSVVSDHTLTGVTSVKLNGKSEVTGTYSATVPSAL